MMSKIDRYDMMYDDNRDKIIQEKFDSGDWCKYEDVKELVEKLESRIDTLETAIMRKDNHVCTGQLPY